MLTDSRLDDDRRYRAVLSRDARFDGWFIVGVTSTGIYCRPSCPAPVRPKRSNVRFYATAAAAEAEGFRACKRCAPDATPGSPEWDVRADLAGRALRLIDDGVVDRCGVSGLAAQLAVSERHLERTLRSELGATPVALARSRRAHTARTLIETTTLPFAEVAFAAGFSSVRQFNATVRAVFDRTPTQLRDRGRRRRPASSTTTVRLPFRHPYAVRPILDWLAARAVPGVEEVDGLLYRRSLRLSGGPAVVTCRFQEDHVAATLRLSSPADLPAAVSRCRRLLDLDADPETILERLTDDPALRRLVETVPGLRLPGSVDPVETAIRAVLGQQVSVAAARTLAEDLALRLGEPLPEPVGSVMRLWPTSRRIAEDSLEELGMPDTRRQTIRRLAAALATEQISLHAGADRVSTRQALLRLPGIGPWTAGYVVMRGLHDPDVTLPCDAGIRRAATQIGLSLDDHETQRWAPWRSYVMQHLWNLGSDS